MNLPTLLILAFHRTKPRSRFPSLRTAIHKMIKHLSVPWTSYPETCGSSLGHNKKPLSNQRPPFKSLKYICGATKAIQNIFKDPSCQFCSTKEVISLQLWRPLRIRSKCLRSLWSEILQIWIVTKMNIAWKQRTKMRANPVSLLTS